MGLFLVGYYWGNQFKREDQMPPAIAGVLVRPPLELGSFTLLDAFEKPFTVASFADHWTLLAFADPSQAPGQRAITRMVEVHNRLAADPDLQEMLLLVLVARHQQDPTLSRDFRHLSPALEILSGDSTEIQRLRTTLGSSEQDSAKNPEDEAPLYLIGPSQRLLALFPGAQEPASVASDLSAIASHPSTPSPIDE